STLAELCRRVDLEKVKPRALEAMIKSGAMDVFGASRRSLMHQLPEALQGAEQQARAAAAGQNDLFGLAEVLPEPAAAAAVPELSEWSSRERLAREKESLGLYLTGHPFDAVRQDASFFVD